VTSAEEFAEFAENTSPRLRRMAFLLCGDWHAAEDLAQTALAETVYVVHNAGWFVTPISTITNTAGKRIRAAKGATGIAVTPDGKTVYVANWRADTVTPITTATNRPGKPIKVGKVPNWITITPDGRTAYVPIGVRAR
jgi:hyaluronoglucosaminidase